jgi:hypothetical protein
MSSGSSRDTRRDLLTAASAIGRGAFVTGIAEPATQDGAPVPLLNWSALLAVALMALLALAIWQGRRSQAVSEHLGPGPFVPAASNSGSPSASS